MQTADHVKCEAVHMDRTQNITEPINVYQCKPFEGGVWTIARRGLDVKSIPWLGGLIGYTCSGDKAFNSFPQKA